MSFLRRLRHSSCRYALLAVVGTGMLGPVTSAYAGSKDTLPDWVLTAAAQPSGSYSPQTSAVILLDQTILTVGSDGRAVEHRRRVVKILRPSGRDEGTVVVSFDKDTKILSLHVWSIAPDGHQYALKDSDIAEYGYPGGGNLYADMRFRVARAPGRDPGGVVAYEFEQVREPYLHEATWFFQNDVPRLNQSFTLELPPGFTYGTVWAHHSAVTTIDTDRRQYRWDLPATPAIDLDEVPMHPAINALAGRMTVHYGPKGANGTTELASWKSIGEWYAQLSSDRLSATPEIAAKTAELTAGKTDFYEKTEAVGEFVQKQIRYFVIEMGIGGLQPHPAGDIFRNRYGDCKDKATLLSAMLSTVGIHSALMMVDSERGVIDPDAPSTVGNHMIAAIEIPPGYNSPRLRSTIVAKTGRRYLIFDPTWDKTAFGQLEHGLQGGFGVLFEGKDTEIAELPLLSPELNSVRRSATFQLSADGTLKGDVTEKRFGDLSEGKRELYIAGDAREQQASLDGDLRRDFSAFTTADFKVENANAFNKDLTTTYKLSADRFGRSLGPLLLVRPRVLGTDSIALDRKPRRIAIDLRQTRLERDDFTIELPSGYGVDEMPEPVKLDLGFASYESASQLTGSTLHYTRTYTVRQVSLPPDRYADVQKLAAAIDADEQNHAVLKKK